MDFWTFSLAYSVGLLIGLLVCLRIGYKLGCNNSTGDKEKSTGNALDGVVFALLGLLLAFIFSGSMDSYNTHRDLLVKEAHNIYEAYLMLDLLPADSRDELRSLVVMYDESRLASTQSRPDSEEEEKALDESQLLQRKMWEKISSAVKLSDNPAVINNVLAAVSAMTSSPADQLAAQRSDTPAIIYFLIYVLAMMAALIAGYGMTKRSLTPLRMFVFSVSVMVTMYTIIDLDTPRSGFFISDPTNRTLIEVTEEMRQGLGD